MELKERLAQVRALDAKVNALCKSALRVHSEVNEAGFGDDRGNSLQVLSAIERLKTSLRSSVEHIEKEIEVGQATKPDDGGK